ncbi:hypothetical protein CCHR01_04603 [Colletotrichum chrysophilum]|uniref:Uncharacterized protein n=1 Tax=Colletotrichum chrysophilum TaxID=1836956 RepID=A0AAD9EMD4_9PEZI|nr:hypothetical protein K456DRAFT_902526 [Colletotrichum gloeosporioides 23]KAK1852752.1 hypothetical protein CCHR01_04603 [Colletotrichum chrysophilum]
MHAMRIPQLSFASHHMTSESCSRIMCQIFVQMRDNGKTLQTCRDIAVRLFDNGTSTTSTSRQAFYSPPPVHPAQTSEASMCATPNHRAQHHQISSHKSPLLQHYRTRKNRGQLRDCQFDMTSNFGPP